MKKSKSKAPQRRRDAEEKIQPEDKVFEVEVRLIVFARVYIAATSTKNAELRLRLPQAQWGGRIDYEDHTAQVDGIQGIKEVA